MTKKKERDAIQLSIDDLLKQIEQRSMSQTSATGQESSINKSAESSKVIGKTSKKKGFIRKMPKIDSVRSAFDVILTDMRELISCVDGIIEKFPKHEKNPCGLGYIMVDELRATDKMVIRGVAYNPQVDREQIMREVSVSMKYLIELINACHNRQYINDKRREAIVRRIAEIDNIAVGVAMVIEKNKRKAQDGANAKS